MNRRRRRVRPQGVAVLALIVIVPIAVVVLILGFAGKQSGEMAPAVPAASEAPVPTSQKNVPPATKKPDPAPATREEETTEKPESAENPLAEPAPAAPEVSETAPAETAGKGTAIAEFAKKLSGTKYKHGGSDPGGFDNSGFVYYVYKQNGLDEVPRGTDELLGFGSEVGRDQLQPGDVLVFTNKPEEAGEFLAVYLGDNQFVASFNPSRGTQIGDLNDWWLAHYISARRFV
ncbi:MAG: C40 family peptidase [Clostridia bacterium]|nr:C40 family peptidase [Clostridia bacterium]